MLRDNPGGSWESYFDLVADRPLHPLYEVLRPHLGQNGSALELGCGIGQGACFFAELGWNVSAVDISALALSMASSRTPWDLGKRITWVEADMRYFPIRRQSFDAIVAAFCLFFLDFTELDNLWSRLVEGLRPGGLLMVQWLGPNDEWVAEGYQALERSTIEVMVQPFEVLHWEEVEKDGFVAQGQPKHWHIHHLVARKHRDV